jgi:hypothetical protein
MTNQTAATPPGKGRRPTLAERIDADQIRMIDTGTGEIVLLRPGGADGGDVEMRIYGWIWPHRRPYTVVDVLGAALEDARAAEQASGYYAWCRRLGISYKGNERAYHGALIQTRDLADWLGVKYRDYRHDTAKGIDLSQVTTTPATVRIIALMSQAGLDPHFGSAVPTPHKGSIEIIFDEGGENGVFGVMSIGATSGRILRTVIHHGNHADPQELDGYRGIHRALVSLQRARAGHPTTTTPKTHTTKD